MMGGVAGQGACKQNREDWVRPMALANHQVLYLGTHQGRLQRVWLPRPGPGLPSPGPGMPGLGTAERWEQLWDNGCGEAMMCLAVSHWT